MENQTDSNTPPKIHAGRLCNTVIISLLLGIGFFLIYILLEYVLGAGRDLKGLLALFSILASFMLIYCIAPLLTLITILHIFFNWSFIINLGNFVKDERLIHKIFYKYLIASLLLILSAFFLLPIDLAFFVGDVQIRNLPLWLSIWLIVIALLAVVMGFITYKLSTQISGRIWPRIGAIFAIFVTLVVLGAVTLASNLKSYFSQRAEYSTMPEIPSVNSNSLEQTVIIPTLDSPCPKNKNVIWCSSFQLAWNQMKEDVIKAPIEVVGAEDLTARLNSAEQTSDDLEPESFYAAAGRINQNIIGTIQKDMAAKFPSHSVPDFNDFVDYPRGILAYSYLIANVPFKYPYRQVKGKFIFTDSNGIETNVGAFGAWGLHSQYKRMREQAEILYCQQDENYQMKEFAVDLCKHSKPYQVVAAVVEPKDTLAQTLSYVQNQIKDFKQKDYYERISFLDDVDVLEIPEMFWQIDHRFEELIDKIVANANPPMPIIEARQSIKFKLDRCGAMLESESKIFVAAIPRKFIFNRPFLVYMKKRDCDRPFFVMWVDNAELLNKKQSD